MIDRSFRVFWLRSCIVEHRRRALSPYIYGDVLGPSLVQYACGEALLAPLGQSVPRCELAVYNRDWNRSYLAMQRKHCDSE